MYIYTSLDFKGELIECNEGDLLWVDKDKVMSLPIWEGDKYFLKYLLEEDKYFVMRLIYEDDKLIKVIEY